MGTAWSARTSSVLMCAPRPMKRARCSRQTSVRKRCLVPHPHARVTTVVHHNVDTLAGGAHRLQHSHALCIFQKYYSSTSQWWSHPLRKARIVDAAVVQQGESWCSEHRVVKGRSRCLPLALHCHGNAGSDKHVTVCIGGYFKRYFMWCS